MANTVIAVRSSGTAAATPSLGVIANGEIALNYADGIIYYKTSSNTLGSIRTTQPAGLTTEVQYNDAGSFGANANFTFNKTIATLNVNNINVSTNFTASAVATSQYIQFSDGSRQYTANAGGSTGLANSGALITVNSASQLYVSNTKTSTSNITGAITIAGGAGVKGNVYADNVFIGGQQAGTIGDAMAMAIALG